MAPGGIRQPRRGDPPCTDGVDVLIAAVVGATATAGLLVWLTGELAGLVRDGRWPPVGPAEVVPILARLPGRAGHPRDAWPPAVAADLPGPVLLYAVGAAVVLLVVAALLAGWRLVNWGRTGNRRVGGWSGSIRRAGFGRGGASSQVGRDRIRYPSARRRRPGRGARWATRADLAPLRVRSPGGDRLVLGRVGRSLVATEARHSALVLGPTQSGKTTGLAIPALLEWAGPIVATSVKGDLGDHTRPYRATLGRTWLFDPTASAGGGPTSRWSPLVEATTWSGAQRVASWLVEATPSRGGLADGAFWFASAAKLLAPMLLAAARGGRTMAEVVRWTNLQDSEDAERLLGEAGEADAVLALFASAGRDERVRSSIYTTLETVLGPYEDPLVAASAEQPDIDPETLLQGPHTLYLSGPAHEQARVQGVFSALVASVVNAAADRVQRLGRPLDPPLLVVLDEAANIAPLPNLDTLASTAAGMGIQLVTVCQDLAQLAARYGTERARTIANNHRAKIVLSGVGDVGTLDTVSGLAGEQAVREQTVTADLRDGRRSTSSSISYRRLAPADELRRIGPGEGVLVYGHLPAARLVLRPWYLDRQLVRRVGTSRALAPPGIPPVGAARFWGGGPSHGCSSS